MNIRSNAPSTHEGGKASRISAFEQLRRAILACMLWEDTFYEDGVAISNRISNLVREIPDTEAIANLAIQARKDMHLRHAPLWIVVSMLGSEKHRGAVASLIPEVVNRADEMGELISLYWSRAGKKVPLASQLKKGLSACFHKFSEYALAKNDKNSAAIRIRDVMFMVHPKPISEAEHELFRRIANDELTTPDTWETNLSAGKAKAETFGRLMNENKLGDLAFLRNLRNMQQAGIPKEAISAYGDRLTFSKILPFRFIAAARAAIDFESDLERYMIKRLQGYAKFEGRTALLIDVSGSMENGVSGKSDMTRMDAACALAMIVRELCEDVHVYTFSNRVVKVPARRAFALRDAIVSSQIHSSTYLREAVQYVNAGLDYDRFIVFTDEQSADGIASPRCKKAYIINPATYENGVGYGTYTHISGFSEAVVDYIQSLENLESDSE